MKEIIETTADDRMQNAECRIEKNGRQLSLGFTSATRPRPGYRRQQMLRARAQSWFDTMRRIVDSAVEWKPTPPARPEQSALDLRRVTEVQVTK